MAKRSPSIPVIGTQAQFVSVGISGLDQFMYPTRINTDAMPVNLALLITGIGVAVIVLVIVGAVIVDRLEKAKSLRSRK
jgi:hypothetical protein